jgi:hypothetical protein
LLKAERAIFPFNLPPTRPLRSDPGTGSTGGAFFNINGAIAGPTYERELPVGRHSLQLDSLGTPNAVKATIMLGVACPCHSGAKNRPQLDQGEH